MLQRHTRYSAKKDIASEAYRVCQVLARRFKVHKNERTKWELRCRDCGKASCFQLYARPEVVDGSEYWVIHNVHLKFECQPKPDNESRHHNSVERMGRYTDSCFVCAFERWRKKWWRTSHTIWDDDSKGRQSPAKARSASKNVAEKEM